MNKKESKFVYFDLDGTILTSQKQITRKSLKWIKKLRKKDYLIGIATGRPPYMIKKEQVLIKPELPIITTNGALVTSKDLNVETPLEMTCLSKGLALPIFKYLVEKRVTFLVNGDDRHYYFEKEDQKSYWVNWLRKAIRQREQEKKWKLQKIDSNFDIKKINVLKFLVVPDEKQKAQVVLKPLVLFLEKLKKTLKNPKDLFFLPSQKHVLDIFNGKVSKGSYLKKMAKKKLIDLKKLTVFGDELNDLSLFEVANTSVAMENASAQLKAKATHITKSNDQNGVAYFIKKRMLNES